MAKGISKLALNSCSNAYFLKASLPLPYLHSETLILFASSNSSITRFSIETMPVKLEV